MKKTLINVIVAAVVSLAVFCIISLILAAIIESADNSFAENLILSLVSVAIYTFSLIYISDVRNGNGEDDVFCDYRDGEGFAFLADLKLVVKRKRTTIITVFAVVLICFASNLVYFEAFKAERAFPLAMLFSVLTSFQAFFPITSCGYFLNFLGHVISAVVMTSSYILALVFYRKHILVKVKNKL